MANAGTVTITLDANTAKLVEGIKRSERSISQMKRTVASAKKSMMTFAKVAVSFYAASKAIDIATDSVRSFIGTAAQFETFEATLTAIQGSSEAAKQSMGWIKEFAKTTPFEIDTVTDSFVKLKAYGLDPQHGLMTTLGNTAAAMGKSISQAVEAVADAVQGENERLKEFGIKASVQGQKIAYSWADSSGKMRNITIDNNKDMIQSTLTAIWNEKYAGAMAARANTWQGMMSNLSDSWTNFKAEIMDAGMFDYIKGIAKTISQYLNTAFDSAKGGAKGFSDSVIGGIKSVIGGVGSFMDAWSGVPMVFNFLKAAFWEMVGSFGTGMNTIQSAWNKLGNTMSTLWATIVNGIKGIFANMINYIVDKINGISGVVNKAAGVVGLDPVFGKLEHVSFDKVKANIVSITQPISNVETAWQYARDARESYNQSIEDIKEGKWAKRANQFIADIDKNVKSLKASLNGNNKEREKAKQLLDKLGAKYGALGSKATSGSRKAAKAAKAHTKALKQQAHQAEKILNLRREYYALIGDKGKVFSIDANKKLTEMMKSGAFSQAELSKAYDAMWKEFKKNGDVAVSGFADSFKSAFEGVLGGDVFSAFKSFFNNISTTLVKPFIENLSKKMGGWLDGLLGNLGIGGSALAGLGVGLVGKLIGGLFSSKLSEAEIKAAAGRTEFDSKGVEQIVNTLKKYQDPQLTATRSMLKHLESMDNNLLAALSSSSSLDLGGRGYTPKTSSVLGGALFASSTELIGSGIKFYDQAVAGFIEGVNADKYQAVKKTSSILGIFTSESIKESTEALSQKMAKQIGAAFKNGLDAAMDALDTLGFDAKAIEEKIKSYVLSIGKVNLKDLNPEEQAKALNAALTEQLNTAVSRGIAEIASPENIQRLNGLIKANEEYVQGLVRIATEHETVRQQLALFRQTVTDFATSDALVQAAGGLDKFRSAMDTFVKNFFSSGEQKQFLQQQLQYALSVYNVALPASKAKFKALMLEVMAKINSTRALIKTLKAEIAAKVAAGKMSLAAAYGELDAKGQIAQAQQEVIKGQIGANNSLVRSSHEAGKASVGFGKSIHATIEAMAGAAAHAAIEGAETAVDSAGNIDYSKITSPAIRAAESELKNLEGLYGTLMQNMGSFADYYNDAGNNMATSANNVSNAAQSAVDRLSNLQKILLEIAQFKAEILDDKVKSARLILDATTKATGLKSLTLSNVLQELNNHMSDFTREAQKGSSASRSLLQDYKDQYHALKAYNEALKEQKRGFEDLRALWSDASDIDKARIALKRAIEDTGIHGVTQDNFLARMNEAIKKGDSIDKWKKLSDALRNITKLEESLMKKREDHLKSLAKEYKSLQDTSLKTLLGFGTQTKRATIASLQTALSSGDFKAATDAFNSYAKAVKDDGSLTYKQKVFDLARANNLIKSVERKNPNADVVKGLELLRKENEELRKEIKTTNLKLDAIERNTHRTKQNTDNEYLKVVGEA